ncbi:hypothetical protein Pla123a_05310 [Posidoniimonas polymericola]|uniref:Ice-binding protein C-terminal domain-containing protein n=1 Tax=Posidoniimonas polymericola TaxID=2528002 RepID=A0A5C5ZEE1_9BACT|nr:PEP-CTERM sorting domain-containing protein [Posidoniimonas polymericola]TWT85724.1 hypothetical protein Pla123a_05310 [Posidoniimonas polymericola]
MSRFAFSLTLFAAMLAAGSASAELVAYEPFDYNENEALNGQNGGGGFTSAWRDAGAAGGTILAGSLAGPAGLPTSGGHALLSGENGTYTIFRDFAELDSSDGATTWYSYIGQRIGDVQDPPAFGTNPYPRGVNVSLFDSGSERLAMGNSSNATADEWSIIPLGSGGLRQGAPNAPYSELHWGVIRIDHIGDETVNDNAYLWIDPDPNVEPTLGTADASAIDAADYSGIDSLRPFIGDTSSGRPAGQLLVDEIRIGTTYADMSGTRVVPEPAALCLAGLAVCGLVGRRRR